MFESMRKAVVHGVEKTWQTIASHAEFGGEKPWDRESNLYIRDMMMHSLQLADNVDAETKAEAIRKIGHLAFTGGPDAAKFAGSHLKTLVDNILVVNNVPIALKVQVVRSMSEIIRGHRENIEKARELGITSILTDFIRDRRDSRLSRWSVYILVYMTATSMACLKEMLNETDNRKDFDDSLTVLEVLSWQGWPKNYATLFREILGFIKSDKIR